MFHLDSHIALYLVLGLAFMALTRLAGWRGSLFLPWPVVYLCLGVLLTRLPFHFGHLLPLENRADAHGLQWLTEITVIISLAAAGIAIDREMGWRKWRLTWRMLGIAMPLTIFAIAGAGMWLLALPFAGALLLGACLAPTDPVLSRGVQVPPPNQGDAGPVEFALTSEAALNDGLAFPFVYLALALLLPGQLLDGSHLFSLPHWLMKDVVYRLLCGIAVGLSVGYAGARYAFHHAPDDKNEKHAAVGLHLMAGILLAYGLTEWLQGYGFIAVFAMAYTARRYQKEHHHHLLPYRFAVQVESMLMCVMLLYTGTLIGNYWHLLWHWPVVTLAAAVLFIIRPLAAFLSLLFLPRALTDRAIIAFFGIRGIGSLFYLAFIRNFLAEHNQSLNETIWATALLTITASIVIHSLLLETHAGLLPPPQ